MTKVDSYVLHLFSRRHHEGDRRIVRLPRSRSDGRHSQPIERGRVRGMRAERQPGKSRSSISRIPARAGVTLRRSARDIARPSTPGRGGFSLSTNRPSALAATLIARGGKQKDFLRYFACNSLKSLDSQSEMEGKGRIFRPPKSILRFLDALRTRLGNSGLAKATSAASRLEMA